MLSPFEYLWEKCEGQQQEVVVNQSVGQILDELFMKIKLYEVSNSKSDIPELERQAIKVRSLGEILFTITKLSAKDNINVYKALLEALEYRSYTSTTL
jgi:hypothetical protein